jgi:tripartite-type tricarboxylate transporter receptor subunit TctC
VFELISARQATAYPILEPPGVTAERVAVLRQAFDAVVKDPDYLSDARKQGLDTDPVSGAEIAALVKKIYASPPDVIGRAKAALEDGKAVTSRKK